VDHISLSDPLTWLGVLVASLLIAGLCYAMRAGSKTPQHPRDDTESGTHS
jgi:hypothetical protein